MNAVGELERGRASFADEAWGGAYDSLSAADRASRLGAADLERLATSAYMLGRERDYFSVLERAYRSHLGADEPLGASRCAFWIGVNLAQRGDMGRAGGWLGRAAGVLELQPSETVEAGYLLLPRVFEQEAAGDLEGAATTAGKAAAIGVRFRDPDLSALAGHERGHILIRLGRLREGLALIDESMVAVTAGELSPIATGIVYCGVILACQDAHAVNRARECTAALAGWCERQPNLVAFTGRCSVHRAQIMLLQGDWSQALEEAERAVERCLQGENPAAAGDACYQQGEIHRLRGDFAAAEEAYRAASGYGWEPQPGFALMRLAQGKAEAAEAAIRRLEAEPSEPGRRAGLLPAYVEVMLAIDDLDAARKAWRELDSLAEEDAEGALEAFAALARGAVALADGDARGALRPLRVAARAWQQLGAPYEVARARELGGLACQELGDEDGAALELEAARATFERLRAATDLARVSMLAEIAAVVESHGLTERELEVLRKLAAGETNRAIAADLVLSVKTVDRHVSNVYAKLGVSSRAAATAYAHQHDLL